MNGTHLNPGFDPIIGQSSGQPRPVLGLDPTNTDTTLTIPFEFVVSRGGEYFFSPPISALSGKLAA